MLVCSCTREFGSCLKCTLGYRVILDQQLDIVPGAVRPREYYPLATLARLQPDQFAHGFNPKRFVC
jgi:hypothetical protein